MLLWLIFAVMTAAVLVVVLRPAFASASGTASAEGASVAVYKDQLADLDKQLARGQVDASEYDSLRTEIARRILRVGGEAVAAPTFASGSASRTVALAAAILIPLATVGLYARLGSPAVPDRPVVESRQVAGASAADLIAKVEARLAEHPEDGRGWDAIAPVYFRLQRYADAADAYLKAAKILGETPPRLAGFAEATVLAHDGIVTDAARAAYEKLRVAEPDRFEPRFWLALADEQDGKRDKAATEYRGMLADAPADVPWRAMVEQRLAAVTGQARGPTEADIKASSSMTPADRSAMIDNMVQGLSQRLKANGKDPDGWEKLITSYVALKKPELAKQALIDARAALSGDAAATSRLDALALRLELRP